MHTSAQYQSGAAPIRTIVAYSPQFARIALLPAALIEFALNSIITGRPVELAKYSQSAVASIRQGLQIFLQAKSSNALNLLQM